jgi:hypothetical protein
MDELVRLKNPYKIVVGKSEGKNLGNLGRRIWEDNIKVNPKGIVREGMDWIGQAHDRTQWLTIMNAVGLRNLRIS